MVSWILITDDDDDDDDDDGTRSCRGITYKSYTLQRIFQFNEHCRNSGDNEKSRLTPES